MADEKELDFEERPWGNYRVLLREDGLWIKRIEVNPGARLSLQKHASRAEKWTITRGVGIVQVDEREIPVKAGTFVDIPRGAVHRMTNAGKEALVFVEVALGDRLSESDIVRLSDDYNRL